FLLSVSFMAYGIRGDQVIYGRYNEIFAPIILLFGFYYSNRLTIEQILLSGIALIIACYSFDINDLDTISTINVTGFWSHINFQIDQMALMISVGTALGVALKIISRVDLRCLLLAVFFLIQVFGYNSNWYQVHYPRMEVRQLYSMINSDELVSFDCEDFYGLSEDGCLTDYTGCYEWLYQKYSFLFAPNQINKYYFEQWILDDERNVFFSSNYREEYSHLIRASEATMGGRHYLYAKQWGNRPEPCFLPKCYKWTPYPDYKFTQVGEYRNGSLYSTGQAGALLYGPYALIPQGSYRYRLFGSIDSSGNVFTDITFGNASTFLYGTSHHLSDTDGVLQDTIVTFDNDLPQAQFRVIVTPKDHVRIDSIHLMNIKLPSS
ncbi:MAG: hypothetical protein AAFR14_11400, partial [Bacteroidota bacterium]